MTAQTDNKAAQITALMREYFEGINQDEAAYKHDLEAVQRDHFKSLETAERGASNPDQFLNNGLAGLS